jgi:hypothetical protein
MLTTRPPKPLDLNKEEVIGDAENIVMRGLTVITLFLQHSQENKMCRTCWRPCKMGNVYKMLVGKQATGCEDGKQI